MALHALGLELSGALMSFKLFVAEVMELTVLEKTTMPSTSTTTL